MSSSKNKKKLPVDWGHFRVLWEADPSMTATAIAKMVGMTQQAVSLRIKREQWVKIPKGQDLIEDSHARADVITTGSPHQKAKAGSEEPAGKVEVLGKEPDRLHAVDTGLVFKTAVELRAKVLDRHRKEWDAARDIVYKAFHTADFEKAKLGKITAEALKVIQDGERKAWGIDGGTASGGGAVRSVTIKYEEREERYDDDD